MSGPNRPPHPEGVYTAVNHIVSVAALQLLADGFSDQARTFVRWDDPENAAWAARHAAHYGRIVLARTLEA